MGIESLVVGDYQANCYLVTDKSGPDLLIIDPGDDAQEIIRVIDKRKLLPKLLVNTHAHIDHIGANRELKERFPEIKIGIHPDDAKALGKPLKNLSIFQGRMYKSPPPELLLEDGQELSFGPLRFKIIHVPGHTPGGIALYCAEGLGETPVAFTGDALFAGGIGRSDFPGGNGDLLVRSIREKLLTLPPRTRVFPGHGPDSTIQEESESNPFLH
jgi:glyoxylase-like metal-dependent hydrolase (beta-lactamase superfamily II)